MTSQPGLQTTAIQIMVNISQSKGNQSMKFGQLIEYNKRNIFFKNYAENEARCLVSDLFIFNLPYSKNKLHKTLDYCSRDILNFNFLEKGLGLDSPPNFVFGFSREMFIMLDSFNCPKFIARLSLLLGTLGNMCITIVC